MKQLSCEAMGESCDFVAQGETEEDVIRKMQEHAQADHPDKWAEMEQMGDDEKKEMFKDMRMKMEEV